MGGQDEIQRNARSADICLAVSLVDWLQSGSATWKTLVEAVFRPAGGGHQVLARDIARNHRSEFNMYVMLSVHLVPLGVSGMLHSHYMLTKRTKHCRILAVA